MGETLPMPAPPRAFFLYGTIAHYRVREGQLPGRHIGYLPTSLQILFGSRPQVYIATWLHGYANTLEREKPFTLLIVLIIFVQILIGSIKPQGSNYTPTELRRYRHTHLHACAQILPKKEGTPKGALSNETGSPLPN